MKTKRILAIELGGTSFKLAAAEVTDGKPTLTRVRRLPLAAPTDEASRRKTLEELLSGIARDAKTNVVALVDDPFAFVGPLLVPPMPSGELAGAVHFELQRGLPIPPEEAVVDYEISEEAESQGVKKLKLLVGALPQQTVNSQLAFLARAGLKPSRLIPRAQATAAWSKEGADPSAASRGILRVGGTSSEFLVTRGGQILFVRKIPVSGGDFTRGMTAVLMTAAGQVGLTEAEAETVKRTVGIPSPESSNPATQGIPASQILAMLRGSLDRLAVEVERSIAFYGESQGGGSSLGELILAGGGAHLKGLDQWLAERLGIPVTAPDPLAGRAVAAGAVEENVATAPLSLAAVLGAVELSAAGAGLNLLPRQIREAAQTQARRSVLAGSIGAAAAVLLVVKAGMGIYQGALEKELAALRVEQSAVMSQHAAAQTTLSAYELLRTQPPLEEIFKELGHAVPAHAYLTHLTWQEGKWALQGKVREVTRTADAVLNDFLRALSEGPFTEVRLIGSRQVEGSIPRESEFEVSCLLK